jgi:hypothetical protein
MPIVVGNHIGSRRKNRCQLIGGRKTEAQPLGWAPSTLPRQKSIGCVRLFRRLGRHEYQLRLSLTRLLCHLDPRLSHFEQNRLAMSAFGGKADMA